MIQQDRILCGEGGYLQDCSRQLLDLVQDPLLDKDGPEALTGESQLRPRTLYPTLL